MRRDLENVIDPKFSYWLVFLIVSGVLVSGAFWVIGFVRSKAVTAAEAEVNLNPAFVNYSTAGDYVSAESQAAIQTYIAVFPEPQNAQVLVNMNTSEIYNFMTTYMAGGLKQDCTYCHNTANFGAEGADIGDDTVATRKATARTHLQMVADLNQNWITKLAAIPGKKPSGAQVSCSTCHNGEAIPVAWPAQQHALPDDYRLPLGNLDVLTITGKLDISLDTVQYNQHTMTHLMDSLGVGCTHCHNSRYFPSWEQPAKTYAFTMLQMSEHIQATYKESMNNQDPSCYLCHRNQVRPPGAVQSEVFLPEPLRSSYKP